MLTAAIVLLVLLLVVAGYSLVLYQLVFYNGQRKEFSAQDFAFIAGKNYSDEVHALVSEAEKIPFEEVSIRSFDKLRLYGRVYLRQPGRPVHIQFNGYRGNGIRDFAGGLQLALSQGDNVVLVDQRAHGKSQGNTICFGVKERLDVLSWCDYVCDRFGEDTPIYLEGISMGGATVLLASSLALPANVRGIFADCPYASPYEIIRFVAQKTVPLAKLSMPLIVLTAWLYGGFRLDKLSAVDEVRRARVPIQIIHGNADTFVPIEMSRAVQAARPDLVSYTEVEGAPHGLSYVVDYELYKKTYLDFLARTGHEANGK